MEIEETRTGRGNCYKPSDCDKSLTLWFLRKFTVS